MAHQNLSLGMCLETVLSHLKGPVLTIMLCAPLLLSWFSRERGIYCLRVLFWRQTKSLRILQHHKNGRQEIAACNA